MDCTVVLTHRIQNWFGEDAGAPLHTPSSAKSPGILCEITCQRISATSFNRTRPIIVRPTGGQSLPQALSRESITFRFLHDQHKRLHLVSRLQRETAPTGGSVAWALGPAASIITLVAWLQMLVRQVPTLSVSWLCHSPNILRQWGAPGTALVKRIQPVNMSRLSA